MSFVRWIQQKRKRSRGEEEEMFTLSGEKKNPSRSRLRSKSCDASTYQSTGLPFLRPKSPNSRNLSPNPSKNGLRNSNSKSSAHHCPEIATYHNQPISKSGVTRRQSECVAIPTIRLKTPSDLSQNQVDSENSDSGEISDHFDPAQSLPIGNGSNSNLHSHSANQLIGRAAGKSRRHSVGTVSLRSPERSPSRLGPTSRQQQQQQQQQRQQHVLPCPGRRAISPGPNYPALNHPLLPQNLLLAASSGDRAYYRRHSDTPQRNANNYIQQSPTAPTATDNGSHKGHRQRSVSLSTPHRASDINVTPLEAATLYRTSRGLPVEDPFVAEVLPTLTGDEHQIFALFFQYHTCYDLIPKSAKLVIFDTKLLVKKAFFALVYNGVRAAPLWDHDAKRFVGMLTITDFIKILRMNYKPSSSSGTPSSSSSGSSLTQDGHAHISADTPTPEQEQVKAAAEAVVNSNLDLEEHKLETWRQALASDQVRDLISIEPEETLYEAIRFLIENKIHRLPIIDKSKGNVLYILTHKRLLRFLFLYIDNLPHPAYFEQSIHTLGIGTYDQIETARPDTRIIEALNKFMEKRISALPIVDEDNKLVDIYAKFDVINLAAEKTYDNLEMTLKDANRSRNEWFEGVHSCKKTDSLFNVMSQIVQAEVHRLVIVDEENRVEGVISLSDILAYVVLRPTEQQGVPEAPTAATVPETDNAPAVPTAGNTAAPETTEEQLAKDFSNKANV